MGWLKEKRDFMPDFNLSMSDQSKNEIIGKTNQLSINWQNIARDVF